MYGIHTATRLAPSTLVHVATKASTFLRTLDSTHLAMLVLRTGQTGLDSTVDRPRPVWPVSSESLETGRLHFFVRLHRQLRKSHLVHRYHILDQQYALVHSILSGAADTLDKRELTSSDIANSRFSLRSCKLTNNGVLSFLVE